MSTSDPDGCVFLMDKPEDIMRKFKRAVTDCETAVKFDKENKAGISNLLSIYCAATGKTLTEAEKEFYGRTQWASPFLRGRSHGGQGVSRL